MWRVQAEFWGGDARFVDPTPDALDRLSLHAIKRAHQRRMRPDRMEAIVVGDFAQEALDEHLLAYLGTLRSPPLFGALWDEGSPEPVLLPLAPSRPRVHRRTISDSEARAVAYISGRCVSRFRTCGTPLGDLGDHPLRVTVALEVLTEIINSRLFSMLRDVLGLVYESSIRFHDYELLPTNGYVVSISAAPGKVDEAHEAALRVLRNLANGRQRITEYDLAKARRGVLSHVATHAKDLRWWLSRLQHVQVGILPAKDARCVSDYREVLESLTIHDLRCVCATLEVDDGEAISVIMESVPPSSP